MPEKVQLYVADELRFLEVLAGYLPLLPLKYGTNSSKNLLRFGHSSLAGDTAGQIPLLRADGMYPAPDKREHVFLRCRVQPHFLVHGRSDQQWGAGRKNGRGQQIIGYSMRDLGEGIAGCRGDDKYIPPLRERDMSGFRDRKSVVWERV